MKALDDPAFMATLAASEAKLKASSRGKAGIGDPWTNVARTMAGYRSFYFADRYSLPSGDLFNYAMTLVRLASERGKPNADRLPGYSDSDIPLAEKRLLDEQPIYPWLDALKMSWSLSKTREYIGPDDPQTKLMLGKESPEALAKRLVDGSKLADPKLRKTLLAGGPATILASRDPMILYARQIDANDRAIQKRFDAEVDAPLTAAQAKLADARFAAFGATQYPDATFTLRISYGKVAGWIERGHLVPTRTTMGGTFDRATGAEPFDLPSAFIANRAKINPAITYDFVTTNDIIGGNSGSPVIDKSGAVIGAAFDGNIHSLGGNYGYDGTLNRTVAVSTAAVEEALKSIYPAPALLAELHGN